MANRQEIERILEQMDKEYEERLGNSRLADPKRFDLCCDGLSKASMEQDKGTNRGHNR